MMCRDTWLLLLGGAEGVAAAESVEHAVTHNSSRRPGEAEGGQGLRPAPLICSRFLLIARFLSSLQPALDPKVIGARATAKWVKEFKYMRASASGALARFMDFVAYEYQIDAILDLIKAATSASSVDMEALVENVHPLGMLDPSVMKSILAYEDLGEDFHALYRTILVDTPVGKYFTQFLTEQSAEAAAAANPDNVRATFSEIPMTLIENSIKKFYLEDFYRFCT
jgi:V-type H+-transporting ATPase subunit d